MIIRQDGVLTGCFIALEEWRMLGLHMTEPSG
jgi:hypothetical protein